mmetsp:Transcript_9799/g.22868  ORF Transcript_9799/g.22868 Transcript_9799/m.22868 type:complete len:733 (-) Transcript_9799:481-2679(-)
MSSRSQPSGLEPLHDGGDWSAWRRRFIAYIETNEKYGSCLLLCAEVPTNSKADRLMAETTADSFIRRHCKNLNIDYETVDHDHLLHQLGAQIYLHLTVAVDDALRVKVLEPSKEKYETSMEVWEAEVAATTEGEDYPDRPLNLATACWQALHEHFAPDAVASRAQRIHIAFRAVIDLVNDMAKPDPQGAALAKNLGDVTHLVKEVGDTSDLTLENVLSLLLASSVVAHEHPLHRPAGLFLEEAALKDLNLPRLSRLVDVHRTQLPTDRPTYAAAAATGAPGGDTAAPLPGTSRDARGKLICGRCGKHSKGAGHTAFNCEAPTPGAAATRRKQRGGGQREGKSVDALMSRLEQARSEAAAQGHHTPPVVALDEGLADIELVNVVVITRGESKNRADSPREGRGCVRVHGVRERALSVPEDDQTRLGAGGLVLERVHAAEELHVARDGGARDADVGTAFEEALVFLADCCMPQGPRGVLAGFSDGFRFKPQLARVRGGRYRRLGVGFVGIEGVKVIEGVWAALEESLKASRESVLHEVRSPSRLGDRAPAGSSDRAGCETVQTRRAGVGAGGAARRGRGGPGLTSDRGRNSPGIHTCRGGGLQGVGGRVRHSQWGDEAVAAGRAQFRQLMEARGCRVGEGERSAERVVDLVLPRKMGHGDSHEEGARAMLALSLVLEGGGRAREVDELHVSERVWSCGAREDAVCASRPRVRGLVRMAVRGELEDDLLAAGEIG